MNFTIFRNFSGIFLNLFDFILILKCFKLIKKMRKRGLYLGVYTCGSATWTAGPPAWREREADVAMTWPAYFYLLT